MNELLPCPFCGSEAELTTFGFSWEPLAYGVQCIADAERGLDAHGHQIAGFGSAEKAIAAWNSRAERTCHNVSTTNNFRCSECDAADLDFDKPSYCHGCGAKVVGE